MALTSTLIFLFAHGDIRTRKNVLYMVADDMRPEWNAYCPSCNIITPNLDKLAATGLLFTHAYCQQSICGPSRNSFLSGRRPDTTLTFNFRDNFRTSPMHGGGKNWVALPEYFKNAGYDTRGSGKVYHDHSPPNADLPRSWNEYIPAKYPPAYGNKAYLVCCKQPVNTSGNPAEPCYGGDAFGNSGGGFCRVDNEEALFDYVQANHTIELLRNWTKGKKAHPESQPPFFYAVGWKMPHAPFGAPSRSFDLYEPIAERVPLAANRYRPKNAPNVALITDFFLRNGTDTLENGHAWGPDRPVEDYVERLNRQAYYAAVTYTDEQIGRVLNELDALGLTNDTLVIMHADHGYALGEHNAWEKKSNLEIGTRVPLVIRAPWKPAAIGVSTNALVELVDLYPTFARLAGLPSPPGLDRQGTDLSPLFDNPVKGSAFKNVSFSQYPVCSPPTKVREFTAGADCPTCRMCRGCSTNATVDSCGTHGCIGVPRTNFEMMGYSVRVDKWRYTAWLPWVGQNLTGNWSATPISADAHYNPGENYYRELYDHRENNGTGCFDCFENENVAELPINAEIVAELHAILRNQFGYAHVKSCVKRSPQPGVHFDTQHHGNVDLGQNRTTATWPDQDSCDAVVLLDVNATNPYHFWLDIQQDKGGYIDIGFCARDVNTSGKVWMGHQKGKAWVYRALGLFADSWVTHGKGPSSKAQGVPYGRKYGEGDRVGVKMLNSSAIEFFLNNGSLGAVKTASPMPPNVVGCASTCMGAKLSTEGCIAKWIDVKV